MNPFSLNALAPTWAVASEILKGDLPGHIFRGNQWRDATGNMIEQHARIKQAVAEMEKDSKTKKDGIQTPKNFKKLGEMYKPLVEHHQEQKVLARMRGDEEGERLHEAARKANMDEWYTYRASNSEKQLAVDALENRREQTRAATEAADNYTAQIGAPMMRDVALGSKAARTPGIEVPFEDPGYLAYGDRLKADFIVDQFRQEQKAREGK